ncbi:MAG TPA: sugar transferase [Candidatus Bathyarchaeia archaeon]|nr:sugar transferase [Candidatus Bathyarchaeia archaeon]
MSYEFKKRILDITIALLLTAIFFPIFLVVPLIIKLTSSGPVFYGQRRIGKSGKEFTLFKFRSMVVNADEIIARDKKLLRKFKESDWKLGMKEDPRITKFGMFMRTFTIDEFPQIWNVLKGEMSIVGPRAYRFQEIKEQLEKYSQVRPLMKQILSAKPGITGPWQTSGRNEVPFLKRAKMDANYSRLRSIWKDIKILIKTPKAMLSRW